MNNKTERLKEYAKMLINKYGSPLYVYDYEILKKRCEDMSKLQEQLENALAKKVRMHYSTKANSNPYILETVKEAGLYVDCMSPVELMINKKCGFKNQEILYVCNNITAEEMKLVYESKILICLDSISQVDTWGKQFPGTKIMVRINPGVVGVGHSEKVITSGKLTKFGITEENFEELFEVAKKYNLTIIGIHQHLGSLFLNDKIDNYIMGVKAGLNLIKKHFKNIKIVDLGGGFGVPYKPEEKPLNLDIVSEKLIKVLKEFINEYQSVEEFKFEPGRYIPCEAGYLIGQVTAIKHENGQYYIGTDIGMNQLVRPSMYDAYHEITIFGTKSEEKIQANIVGNICESGDILGKNRTITLPNIGDLVVVSNAGAYGSSMASNYTGRLRPGEVMIYKDGRIEKMKDRETETNILQGLYFPKKYKI